MACDKRERMGIMNAWHLKTFDELHNTMAAVCAWSPPKVLHDQRQSKHLNMTAAVHQSADCCAVCPHVSDQVT